MVTPADEPKRELLDQSHAVLRVKMQALLEHGSRRVTLQLFWEPEAGGGFSQAASQRCSVMAERGRARAVFQLPARATRPRQLRLDLAEEPAMVTIRSIRICGPTGTLLWQWTAVEGASLPVRDVSPNTLVQKGGVVLAETADPWVVLDVPDEVLEQLEAKAELELPGLWQPLPQDVAAVALSANNSA